MEMWGFDSTTFEPKRLKATSNALHTYPTAFPGSEISPSSTTNGWQRVYSQGNVLCCDGTSAVAIGGGAANDTMLLGILIQANGGGAATATIAGFGKTTDGSTYTAKTLVLTGSTSVDTFYPFPGGLVNNVGAMTVTGSVDEVVWVFWRPL